jgi:hypothetical protein
MNLIKRLLGIKPEPVVVLDEDEELYVELDPYLDSLLERAQFGAVYDDEDDTNNFYMEMEEMD